MPTTDSRWTKVATGRSSRSWHPAWSAVLPAAITGVLLVTLIPIALGSMIGAAFAAGSILLLIVVLVLGLERAAIVVITVGFVLAPMNRVRPVQALTFVTASDVFLVVGIGLLLPLLVTRALRIQVLLLVGVAGIIVAALISSALNPFAFVSLNNVFRLVVGALALPVIFAWWRPPQVVVPLFAAAYVSGNAISVANSVVTGASAQGRFIGLTMHPNILGLCSMLALALVPFLLRRLPVALRAPLLVAAGAAAYGIWISGSRAALVVTVAVALIYPLLARSIPVFLTLAGLSLVPMYLVARAIADGAEQGSPLSRVLGDATSTPADIERALLADEAIERFAANPLLGGGFADALEAHNVYLQVAAAGGLVALVFYLIMLAAVLRQPLLAGANHLLLVLPGLSYVMIAYLTTLMWDRYIWVVLALPFLLPAVAGDAGDAGDVEDADEDRSSQEAATP